MVMTQVKIENKIWTNIKLLNIFSKCFSNKLWGVWLKPWDIFFCPQLKEAIKDMNIPTFPICYINNTILFSKCIICQLLLVFVPCGSAFHYFGLQKWWLAKYHLDNSHIFLMKMNILELEHYFWKLWHVSYHNSRK